MSATALPLLLTCIKEKELKNKAKVLASSTKWPKEARHVKSELMALIIVFESPSMLVERISMLNALAFGICIFLVFSGVMLNKENQTCFLEIGIKLFK